MYNKLHFTQIAPKIYLYLSILSYCVEIPRFSYISCLQLLRIIYGIILTKMVPRSGLDSNQLFEELDRWETVLKHHIATNASAESPRLPKTKSSASRSPRARKVKRAGGQA